MVTELRFPSPGWKFYLQGGSVSFFGIGFLALGLAVLSFVTWKLSSILAIVGALFSTLLGLTAILLVWFMYVYGAITNWRDWRQFASPAVVLDSRGARYEALRKSALVTWGDIEQVRVHRTIFPKKNVTKISLRLEPGAAAVREGSVRVPDSRYLNVGLLSELSMAEDDALRFLGEIAGSRLEILETDRRPEASHR